MGCADVDAWRRERRIALIAEREALTQDARTALQARVSEHLAPLLCLPAGTVIAFCWPHRNEIDVRFAVRVARDRGAAAAMPVVVGKCLPLDFRLWWPGVPMKRGALGIAFPDGSPRVVPDVVLVPMVAFDEHGYRLGYGGGFFDRTLATLEPRPIAVGVAAARFRLDTVHPQAHDIAMDFVVTEEGAAAASATGLVVLDDVASSARMGELFEQRGLPRRRAHPGVQEDSFASPVCYAKEFPGYFGETEPER